MNIKSLFLCTLVLGASVPSTSHALSCLRLNAGTTVERIIETGYSPLVVVGFPVSIEREQHWRANGLGNKPIKRPTELQTAHYQITGLVLGTGQTETIDATFSRRCSRTWGCHRFPEAFKLKTFVFYEKGGILHGNIGPCGGSYFPAPTQKQRNALESCVVEKNCGAAAYSLEGNNRPAR